MLKIFEDWYNKGYEAGVTAQKLEQREDFERRMTEMYHFGMAMGKQEMLDEMGAIDLDDVKFSDEYVEPKAEVKVTGKDCDSKFDDNCPGCPEYWNCPNADTSFVLDDIATAEMESVECI